MTVVKSSSVHALQLSQRLAARRTAVVAQLHAVPARSTQYQVTARLTENVNTTIFAYNAALN